MLGTTRTTVRANTVYDTPKQSVLLVGANTDAVLVGNVIQTFYVERNALPPASQTDNCVASGGGVDDIRVPPQFVDRVDYQLAPGSPCAGLGWSPPS
jgi:hypothetical protein